MDKEFEFFIYLLQKYAKYKNSDASSIFKIWKDTKLYNQQALIDFIQSMYFQYHSERLENAFDDIDHIIATGKPLGY